MPPGRASGHTTGNSLQAKPVESKLEPGFWAIEDILRERTGKRGTEYLVRWVGKDPDTGVTWPPEWIPQGYANKPARRAWEAIKARQSLFVSSQSTVSPGAVVKIPPVGSQFKIENYPTISIGDYQPSQQSAGSSETDRDTQSWREDISTLTPSQPQLTLLESLDFQSSPSNGHVSDPRLTPVHPQSAGVSSDSQPTNHLNYSIGASSYRNLSTLGPIESKPRVSAGSLTGTFSAESAQHAQVISALNTPSEPDLQPLDEEILSSQYQGPSIAPGQRSFFLAERSSPIQTSSFSPDTDLSVAHNKLNQTRIGSVKNTFSQEPPSRPSSHISISSVPPSSNFSSILSQISPNPQLAPTEGSVAKQTGEVANSGLPKYPGEARVSGIVTPAQQRIDHKVPRPAQSPGLRRSSPSPSMSSSLNGGRSQSRQSPPMQDRVRSIRNSALSSQSRKPIYEENSPMSSRSTSLAPEPTKQKVLSESRSGSRQPELADSHQFARMFPEDSDDSETSPTARYNLTLPFPEKDLEFFVPLPLPSRVKSQYDATIKYFKKSTKSFLSGILDPDIVQHMRRLVQRLNNVSTHVDLENEEWEKSQSEPTEDQLKWTLSSGSKFVFLHSLCNVLRDHSFHIAVVAKEPRVLYILEQFMQSIKIDHVRPDTGKRSVPPSSQSRLKVSLISVGSDAQLGPWASANLVIAFDGSFDPGARHIQTLRNNPTSPRGLAPVVHPMVYCSAEHLSKCIEGMDQLGRDIDKLRALVIAIDERQSEIGEMAPDDFKADAAGEEVANFVLSGCIGHHWTILPVRPVKVLGLEGLLHDELSPAPGVDDSVQAVMGSPTARKRPSEGIYEDSAEHLKRQRMSPIAEVTHISDTTIASQSAQIAELRRSLEAAESALRDAQQTSAARIEHLESQLTARDEMLAEHRKATDDLQGRFEKVQRAARKFRAERDDLEKRRASEEQHRRDALARYDAKALELDEARAQLASSTIPEVAQFEHLRAENRTLLSDKESAQRKADNVSKDFEYTRQQYQRASSAVVEQSAQIRELEAEAESLRQKASGEAARLRELTNRQEVETHIAENNRLRAEVEEIKEQLKRKERGRGMTTRTGSTAPRSPRLGASPGRSRAGSRAPGSRQASPVRSFYGARRGRGLVESL